MENKKLLNIVEKLPTIEQKKLPTLVSQFNSIVAEEFSKEDSENGTNEFTNYMTKRLFGGGTLTDPLEQARFLASTEFFFTNGKVIKDTNFDVFNGLLEDLVNPKNAVTKGERVYLQLAYTTDIFILMASLIDAGALEDEEQGQKLEKVVNKLRDNIVRNSNYVYFVAANLIRMLNLIQSAEEGEFVQQRISVYQALFNYLIKKLLKITINLDNFRNAYLFVVLRLGVFITEVKLEPEEISGLNEKIKSILNKKTLYKFFMEIVQDEKLNSKTVVPFYKELARLVNFDIETYFPFVMNFFKVLLKSTKAKREVLQKRSMHFNLFLSEIVGNMKSNFFSQFSDLDSALKSAHDAIEKRKLQDMLKIKSNFDDIMVNVLIFWLKNFSSKSKLTKESSRIVENRLNECLLTLEEKEVAELSVTLIKIIKWRPGNSLRGKKFGLVDALYSKIYQDDKNFEVVFDFFVNRAKSTDRASAVNFYLNEIMSLAQVPISAKALKDNKPLVKSVMAKRVKLFEFLVEIYVSSNSVEGLSKIFTNVVFAQEEKFRLRNFRREMFERIMNVVFKRQDQKFLQKASSLYVKKIKTTEAWENIEGISQFYDSIKKSIKELKKAETTNEHFLNLLNALRIQDINSEDIAKNQEVVADLTKSIGSLNDGSQPRKKLKVQKNGLNDQEPKPQDIFVDSLIALCSTTYPQLRVLINKAYESSIVSLTKNGFSLIIDAIVRNDREYISEQIYGAEDSDGMEVEEGEGDNEGENED